mmetsp:Transcript_10538/g.15836  ORF Transcript_10538/g.15836 Transcript_10538/m.15836 type:complete len:345 (-) Transcript_10538:591-1625(-)
MKLSCVVCCFCCIIMARFLILCFFIFFATKIPKFLLMIHWRCFRLRFHHAWHMLDTAAIQQRIIVWIMFRCLIDDGCVWIHFVIVFVFRWSHGCRTHGCLMHIIDRIVAILSIIAELHLCNDVVHNEFIAHRQRRQLIVEIAHIMLRLLQVLLLKITDMNVFVAFVLHNIAVINLKLDIVCVDITTFVALKCNFILAIHHVLNHGIDIRCIWHMRQRVQDLWSLITEILQLLHDFLLLLFVLPQQLRIVDRIQTRVPLERMHIGIFVKALHHTAFQRIELRVVQCRLIFIFQMHPIGMILLLGIIHDLDLRRTAIEFDDLTVLPTLVTFLVHWIEIDEIVNLYA